MLICQSTKNVFETIFLNIVEIMASLIVLPFTTLLTKGFYQVDEVAGKCKGMSPQSISFVIPQSCIQMSDQTRQNKLNLKFQDSNATINLEEFLCLMSIRMKANEKLVFNALNTDFDG